MISQTHLQSLTASVGSSKPFRILLLVALALAMWTTAPSVPATEAYSHTQPALLDMATQRPHDSFEVIVQKAGRSTAPEEAVSRLGGQVTRHLDIINSFSARLRGNALSALARTPGVRWVSLDAPVIESVCESCIETARLQTVYNSTVRADRLWNEAPYRQGQSVTVAILDSGLHDHDDIEQQLGTGVDRIKASVRVNNFTGNTDDSYGHGSHVAGTIGGNGLMSNGEYVGVAPRVDFVSVKVADDEGRATTSDVVAGIEWINNNKARYNIRVVNVSMNSDSPQSYHTSPMNAALEILWFNGVVVVVSAGNNGGGNVMLYPPANDPFFITVGATDDRGTVNTGDDVLANFSARGVTESGFVKPDLVAPGTNIISLMGKSNSTLSREHPGNRVRDSHQNNEYFRMSGTSTSAPMVAGAAALLLQDEPNLTPDQVKYRLMATARPFNGGSDPGTQAGHLDVYAAVTGTTTQSANTGITASQLLWTGSQPVTWGSVNWNSVNWNSVNWNSVNWNSVNWNSVNWNSDYWGP